MRCVLILSLFPLSVFAAKLNYEVRFLGLSDPRLVSELESASELLALKDRPPASIIGLRYRIRADIPNLLKILKAYAYFDSDISYEIEWKENALMVDLFIYSGPQYKINNYEVYHGDCSTPLAIERCGLFYPERLGIEPNGSAESVVIVNAETMLLSELAQCGYPLAYIDKRRMIANVETKTVDAATCVQEGPLSRFGPVTFFGVKNIKPRFIDHKIAWREGEIFNSNLVDETQRRLLKSDLFSSVLVTHSEEISELGELSMKIRLSEAKHRSISLGVFYATVDGPGATITWIHRNLRGMGERLSLEANVSWNFYSGAIAFVKPDFLQFDQTLTLLTEVSRENINAYHATTYLESNRVERQVNKHCTFSIGLQSEYVQVQHSATNGNYLLLGLPIYGKYTTANTPLDPTSGYCITYTAIPYQSLRDDFARYVKQTLTISGYIPLEPNHRVVFALHTEFGSVAGARRELIPLPDLFIGGSEGDLRGYAYKTVSPVTANGGILGGRSAIYTTFELRFRVAKSVGIVPFVDFGTIASQEWPQFNAKWYKSLGVGVRYFTFFGPLRFDVGFPLNKLPEPAEHRQTWGKIYASIGQTF